MVIFAPYAVFSVSYYIAISYTLAEILAKREANDPHRQIVCKSESQRTAGRLKATAAHTEFAVCL